MTRAPRSAKIRLALKRGFAIKAHESTPLYVYKAHLQPEIRTFGAMNDCCTLRRRERSPPRSRLRIKFTGNMSNCHTLRLRLPGEGAELLRTPVAATSDAPTFAS